VSALARTQQVLIQMPQAGELPGEAGRARRERRAGRAGNAAPGRNGPCGIRKCLAPMLTARPPRDRNPLASSYTGRDVRLRDEGRSRLGRMPHAETAATRAAAEGTKRERAQDGIQCGPGVGQTRIVPAAL